MAPLILIVGRVADEASRVRGEAFALGQRYCRAIVRAGGIPLMVPPMPELLPRLDELLEQAGGIVLHGGGDVDPRRYGQVPTAEQLYGIVAEHDEVELAVARAAVQADVPVLAICRGLQVLNVALGGTLIQDIGTDEHWYGLHRVDLDPSSLMASVIGNASPQRCHCVHHQAIDRVADSLRVVGRDAHDHQVHAVEAPDRRWVLGVQWHPEDTAGEDSEQQRLFDALVARAAHATV